MFESGFLTGIGAGLLGALSSVYDSVMRAGSDLFQAAFNYPIVSLSVVFAALLLGILGLRR